MNLQDFQTLVSIKLKTNIISKIQKFIPTLKYVYYNQTFSDVPPDTHGQDHHHDESPARRTVIHVGPDYLQLNGGQSALTNAIDSVPIPHVTTVSSLLNDHASSLPNSSKVYQFTVTHSKPHPSHPAQNIVHSELQNSAAQEECPNLDGVAQHEIDFSRVNMPSIQLKTKHLLQ